MPTRPSHVVVDSADPGSLAHFWAAALGWAVTSEEPDEVAVELEGAPVWDDGGPPALVFVPVPDPKQGKNRVHLDLAAASVDDQQARVRRLLDLGARELDIGQRDVPWVVLADPEGNEFCVLDPREEYADAPGIAAVVVDCLDPAALAPYWSAASGWPLAERVPGIAAFGPPDGAGTWLELLAVAEPKQGKSRLHVDVAPFPGDDQAAEVARLERAGGVRVDIGQGDVTWVVLADPEGNEHCVLTPR